MGAKEKLMENRERFNDLLKSKIRNVYSDSSTPSFQAWLEVKDVMSRDVITISPDEAVVLATKVMSENNISCIIVVDNASVVGILTETDVLKRAVAQEKDFNKLRVRQIMSSSVETVSSDLSVIEASKIMEEKHIKRLPIMEERRLVGIVTQTDLVRVLTSYGMWRDVKEIMSRDVAGIQSKATVLDAAKIMASRNITCIIALKADEPVGILTEKDLLKKIVALQKNPAHTKVEKIMSSPVVTVSSYYSVFSASRIMEKMDIRRLVIMEDKKLLGIVTQTDIFRTVKKKLQEQEWELRKQNEFLNNILQYLTHPFYVIDANDYTIKMANSVAWQGKLPEKATCYMISHKRDKPCDGADHLCPLEEVKKTREPVTVEHVHYDKDGNPRCVEVHAYPVFNDEGNVTQVIEYCFDITARKRTEQELEQANRQLEASVEQANQLAQQATVANTAKSEFLANMSHEIRTPMNAIIGFSEVLAEERLTAEQKHHLDIIRGSAENLLQLINDILDFSKIEAGKLNIEIADCSLEELLAVVESLMRPGAAEKGLAFEVLQCTQLPAQIHTDPLRLRQCLTNLINNAVKFTEKGHVHVNVSLQQAGDKPYIRFDVEDTGIGIPAEKQEKMFELFIQADGGTTRKYGGTGLGLTITKRLAQLLGGELSVTSKVGKGSVFSITIPVGVDVKSQPLFNKYDLVCNLNQQQQHVSQQAKFSGRVLVAEDSVTNQMLIKLLLEKMGLQVTTAENGKEAVRKALSQSFDLIFMDIQMPDMNGYDATRALRKKAVTIPIVALTAHAMMGDDKKCISAGCNDYLAKPISSKKLFETVRRYLPSQSTALSESIDSVKSQADELSRLCSDTPTSQAESAEPANEQDDKVPVDWSAVMKAYDGDEDIIKGVAKLSLEEGPQIIHSLAEAIKAEDAQKVKFYAHKLKGVGRHLGAGKLSDKAHRLECAAIKGNLENAEPLFADIEQEFEKLKSFLSDANWIETAKQQTSGKRKINEKNN
jgi:signal transduction histidine kinase/CBS domain-containing protein/DNA-binding NarL/FixJ family response regulator